MDITGFWAGQFHYSEPHYNPVSFDCEIVQTAGFISGNITETSELKTTPYFIISSILEGTISNRDVAFTKIYQSENPAYVPVVYEGKVNTRETEITGIWKRPDWSGTFIMRKDKGATQQKREVTIANDVETVR